MSRRSTPAKRWTEQELKILFEHYEAQGPQFCSELLSTLGFSRSRSACGQTGRLCGLVYQGEKKGCFRPGQAPPNKGRKMSPEVYRKAAPTMFQPGTRRGAANNNYVPIGHETMRSDDYWWVKIAEKKWELKHRLLWEKHNGPIPPGMLIIFRDGNPHNFSLDNLEMITRKELCTRNRWGSGPQEYSLISGRAAMARLNKKGITDKTIRQNPQLLELSKAETLLKLKIRNQRHDTSR
jgi:hypothetical protein